MKLVEALAKHGILTGAERARAAGPQRDVDVQLIADTADAAAHTAPSSRPGTRCWSSTTRPWC